MKNLSIKNARYLVLILPLILIPYFIGDPYILTVLISILLFGGLATAFDLSNGFLGIFNFGIAGFFGIGAYVSALCAVNLGISPWVGLFIGGAVSALLGAVVGLLTLRLGGVYLVIFTILFSEAARYLIADLDEITRGYRGLSVPAYPTLNLQPLGIIRFDSVFFRFPQYALILFLAIFLVLCVRTLVKSKLGLAFKAIKGDPIWAASLGINLLKYRVINVTISCFLLGLLGGFYAHYFGFLTPDALSINITMQVVAMSLIGGSGTLWGGFVGSALVTILLEIVRIVFAQNITLSSGRFIIFGILIVIVVLFFREGIAGGIKRIMGALTKTRAHLTSSSNK